MPVTLLDLSNNNATPDYHKVKRAGCFGVLQKVSEGLTFSDATYHARTIAARAAGLHVGGYHFAHPHPGTAVAEAQYFCALLGKVERRDLYPALDLETNDGGLTPAQMLRWIRDFQLEVHDKTGVKCLLYSYSAFIAQMGWTDTPGTGAGLWLADYGPNDGHDHGATAPHPWRRFVAHQFTSVGTWPGCSGHVDVSHARSRRTVLAHGSRGLL